MDTVVRALVIGATIVAFSAIYESRSGYNAFDHLAEWIPALIREAERSSRRAAATCASTRPPSTRSRSRRRSSWPSARALPHRPGRLEAARAPLGRRRRDLRDGRRGDDLADDGDHGARHRWSSGSGCADGKSLRFWPLLLVLPVAIHFAVPGALGGIYKAFYPRRA